MDAERRLQLQLDPETRLASIEARLASLEVNNVQTQGRVRAIEKLHDVQESSWLKLLIFVVDGWPLRRVVDEPKPRPWRRRFRS